MNSEKLQNMSDLSEMVFSLVGLSNVAYIKQIRKEESVEFAVCAADGTQLATFPTHAEAYYTAKQHNLEPASIH